MHCPSCGTQDVRKVSVAYEMGVEKTRSKTIFGGGLLSIFGPMLGVGGAITRGTNETLQAQRLAPPQKSRPILSAFLVFLGLGMFGEIPVMILGWIIGKPGLVIGSILWLIAVFLLPALILVQGVSRNRRIPGQLEKWNKLFICDRCGEVFTKDVGITESRSVG